MSTQPFMLRHWVLVVVCSTTLLCTFKTDADEPATNYDTSPIRVGGEDAAERIRAELLKPTSLDFADVPLNDVITFIADLHQLKIVIDQRSLDDLGIDKGSPVTGQFNGIALRSALELMLSDLDLTYMIDSEVLIVTSVEEAETRMKLVVYPVNDLLPPGVFSHKALIHVIVARVNPTSWHEVGGPGSIVGFRDSLVVLQTERVHEHLYDLLQGLRQLTHFKGRENPVASGGASASAGGGGGGGGFGAGGGSGGEGGGSDEDE